MPDKKTLLLQGAVGLTGCAGVDVSTYQREILDGLARGAFETHFPKRFTWWMRRLSRLPERLRLPLIKRVAQS